MNASVTYDQSKYNQLEQDIENANNFGDVPGCYSGGIPSVLIYWLILFLRGKNRKNNFETSELTEGESCSSVTFDCTLIYFQMKMVW